MNSREELLAEIEEKSQKNNKLGKKIAEPHAAEPGFDEGYNPYDNPGIHKRARIDDTAYRRLSRRR